MSKKDYYAMVQGMLADTLTELNKDDALKILKKLGYKNKSQEIKKSHSGGRDQAKPFYRHSSLGVGGFSIPKSNKITGQELENMKANLRLLVDREGPLVLDRLKEPEEQSLIQATGWVGAENTTRANNMDGDSRRL
ncbi:MAG: hypothetical protein KGJ06_06205 [Pseudomonadota bacterium]|nr:hypothetical protein [Pseudomonadota bacterium]